jgi:hypothetical protein
MAKFTVDQDMKLGAALDQLEDAIEAAYASLRMVKWAKLNVARYAGGILGSEVNAKIRAVPLDVEKLWELAELSNKLGDVATTQLSDFIEDHNERIVNVIVAHEEQRSEICTNPAEPERDHVDADHR